MHGIAFVEQATNNAHDVIMDARAHKVVYQFVFLFGKGGGGRYIVLLTNGDRWVGGGVRTTGGCDLKTKQRVQVVQCPSVLYACERT